MSLIKESKPRGVWFASAAGRTHGEWKRDRNFSKQPMRDSRIEEGKKPKPAQAGEEKRRVLEVEKN
ncbi:hypothetical protein DAPPUDRAFT_256638 [Daphnia pulex]|uniref:Uncharacterized protein n=1 Tax=Daphnia pulex TaxID=6669 RepID=E9HBU1_DAPPU|nr:hypothetical protein DAPPUDRAFT_256638 [Daphnia pulex]|eukprot:EFX70777.1 hypothetical protein DAPPUDRAFT_256638 [Daphnia pulex]